MEIWKPIPGYSEYEASNTGRIRSLKYGKVRILKPAKSKKYLIVGVTNDSGNRYPLRVHSLVALAFIGPRPLGMEVCHNDGNALNNCPQNLRYDTHAENIKDAAISGKMGGSSFSEDQVKDIRGKYRNGASCADLSREYKTPYLNIRNILVGKTYTWVEGVNYDSQLYKANQKTITDQQVLAIREEYATGLTFYKDLAEKYNVDQSAISLIVTGKRRASLGGPIKGINY